MPLFCLAHAGGVPLVPQQQHSRADLKGVRATSGLWGMLKASS